MTGRKNNVGAGFVIFKSDDLEKMLVLIREDGIYDIPKGTKDQNESDLDTARRETFEECSIVVEPSEMLTTEASLRHGSLTTYVAVTDKIPEVVPNLHSGILEHVGYEWVTKDKATSNCLSYLTPHIEAAFFLKSICLL